MIKILASAAFAVLVMGLAVQALPPEAVADGTPVQPSFDIAMPAAQPLQTPPQTPVIAVLDAAHAH